MRIAVVGAGAIGGYVAAALARGDAEVAVVARGAQLDAIRREGIHVESSRGDFAARPFATDDAREIGPVDVVFLGLKAYSYANAAPLVHPLLGEQTALVAAQNGIPWWYFHGVNGRYAGRRVEAVDPGGAVSAVLQATRAIGCVVYCSTEIIAPGVIRHLEGTRFSIGEPDGRITSRCVAFSEAMIRGGLKCPVESDIRREIWIKLLGNVVFNPVSALTRATLAAICRFDPTRRVAAEAMRETISVARAVGCDPGIDIERRIAGAERVGEHKTSTLQDLEAGKPLELSAIISAVIELADLTDTSVPHLRTIWAATLLLADTLGLNEPPIANPPQRESAAGGDTTRR